jgi:simple sugar transport system permease protein
VDDLVAKGARLIIANSDDMKDGARESAKKHPEVTVIHVSGDDVLNLLCRDFAYFLGHPFARKLGPELPVWSLPGISALPFLGVVLGRHTPVVYLSLILIPLLWWWVFRTRPGLELRAVGEKPQSAFARGIRVHYLRILYTLVGGALVGLAGGAFSLAVKPGWWRPQGAEGADWIALALVIFGGWHPVRAALGAYLFAPSCRCSASRSRSTFPGCPHLSSRCQPFP